MARSPIIDHLRKQFALHDWASAHGRSVEEVRDTLAEIGEARKRGLLPPDLTRRGFLAATGAAAGMTALGISRSARAAQPRIAILGAGISGLTAAVYLIRAGYDVILYEWADDVGGRVQSDRGSAQGYVSGETCNVCHQSRSGDDGTWDDDYVTDIYGELIDTEHTLMRDLCDQFGVDLVDMLAAELPGSTETYYFLGDHYSKDQCDADFADMWNDMHYDLARAGYPTTWDHSNEYGRFLDNMSIADWIDWRVPGGHDSALGRLIDVAYVIEFGAECTDQSSLSCLYLLGYASRNSFSVFGTSDERFRAPGGLAQLPRNMADIGVGRDRIRFGHQLEALSRASDGSYVLSFALKGGGKIEERADIVLCTISFAVLRDLDYSGAGFVPDKDYAIQELGFGKNGKLHVQFSERFWNRPFSWGLSTGTFYSDNGMQAVWDPTRGIVGPRGSSDTSGKSGILVKYTGALVTEGMRQKHPYGNATDSRTLYDAETFLDELEQVFPEPPIGWPDGEPWSVWSYWNGKAAGSMAHNDPHFNCAYSYWKVGQYQTIAGWEAAPQDNVFFAGEHCSVDYQGWMEGAVRSGRDAAASIIARIRGKG